MTRSGYREGYTTTATPKKKPFESRSYRMAASIAREKERRERRALIKRLAAARKRTRRRKNGRFAAR